MTVSNLVRRLSSNRHGNRRSWNEVTLRLHVRHQFLNLAHSVALHLGASKRELKVVKQILLAEQTPAEQTPAEQTPAEMDAAP